MSGAAGAALATGKISLAVGIAGTDPWGFAAGVIGSCAPNTFISRNGTTRTIDGILYNGGTTQIFFRINGAAVPDNDDSFVGIIVGGTLLLRSARFSYSLPGVYTQWVWNSASNILGTSGTVRVILLK